MTTPAAALPAAADAGPGDGQAVGADADLERRFGGLRRLYGDLAYGRMRRARVAVVGLGGVGSWAAEALARCGVARLVLVDLDHVSESNINRQVQALGRTVGMAKAAALQQRLADIHPACELMAVEDFATADNWPALLPAAVDVTIDACDQSSAKLALARWALRSGAALVCVGAAGGKQQVGRVAVEDLADTTHDPLLGALRQRLRQHGAAPRQGAIGLRCVFSRERVAAPPRDCAPGDRRPDGTQDGMPDGTLNCHGYGSSVMVTASFGMAAAAEALALVAAAPPAAEAAAIAGIVRGSSDGGR